MEGYGGETGSPKCCVCGHCDVGARKLGVSSILSTCYRHTLYIRLTSKSYSEPKWPNIPGIEHFKGHKTHSGRWVHDFDYSNKRIAVIGNGSSGIQIVPKMTGLPGTTVRNFIRGPAWVYYRVPPSKHLGRDTDDTNPAYFDSEKEKFRDPVQHREYRKGIIHRTNKAFRLVS